MQIEFNYPITKRIKTPSRLFFQHVGDLQIRAIVKPGPEDTIDVQYQSIKWLDGEILHLLDNITGADDFMTDLHRATAAHAEFLLETQNDHQ